MSTLQQRLAAIAETAANIKAQLRELDRLRDQVRKAQQSTQRPRNRLRNRSEKFRSVCPTLSHRGFFLRRASIPSRRGASRPGWEGRRFTLQGFRHRL